MVFHAMEKEYAAIDFPSGGGTTFIQVPFCSNRIGGNHARSINPFIIDEKVGAVSSKKREVKFDPSANIILIKDCPFSVGKSMDVFVFDIHYAIIHFIIGTWTFKTL
ncbi:uncharacterized protein Gasu_62630 [Galdieria sulphuraria]|uniref:Uncharacterized protein n=1 Tax=Galdieria sulphuraria TaxID=130081 RepID=M2XRL8_GALSU|nr:uncharacterized protein Gasu_62630 [Galdieria sulphuraria]EME26089.1 hypothetical protein Gasu_62630 [Galdieria sulphuraria]|eukprot:XP_005702609.1 hypothetical protein Gasu_62630 [Galdieria sulphuraria]